MYFGLTDERKLLQATLRELVARELPPARLRRCFSRIPMHRPPGPASTIAIRTGRAFPLAGPIAPSSVESPEFIKHC